MTRGWEDVVFSVSTPYGLVDVGLKFEKKNRSSNIVCLLCEQLETFEDLDDFSRHLVREHFEIARFALLKTNSKRMIV